MLIGVGLNETLKRYPPSVVCNTYTRFWRACQATVHSLVRVPLVQVLTDALLLLSVPEPQPQQAVSQPQQGQSQQGQPVTYDGGSLADGLSISEQDQHAQLGFEQQIKAGSFRGRVELQVVRTTLQGAKLFAGVLLPHKGGLGCLGMDCGLHGSYTLFVSPLVPDT